MNYEEALEKIRSFRRFGPKPGLDRIRRLLGALGGPQEGLNVVHAAGTNGKGTACTLMASALTQAGFRTGLYLSPHVCDFRERIQVDGAMIPKDALASLAERVCAEAERMRSAGESLAEFEVITALAFLWFSRCRCDAVVLETGMGGRFDATNVVRSPLVSVILSISLDHTQVLGNTLAQIAYEKCGIIKEGCPCVCSPGEPPEALAVFRRVAAERRSRLTEASLSGIRVLSSGLSGTEMEYRGTRLHLPFPGEHQVRNAAAALAALEVLRARGWSVPARAVARGFERARLPARLEVLSQRPPVLLDGAHNPGGTAALAAALWRLLPGRKIVAVMGMMADKDVAAAVRNLDGLFSRVIAVAPPSPRAMPAGELARIWRSRGVPAEAAEDSDAALHRAASLLGPDSALVVCGSLYLAGALRGKLLARLKK